MIESNKNIAWLTSLPSPYWIPIWNKLSSNFDLKVFFTNKENNERGWQIPPSSKWKHHTFSKRVFYLGQAQIIPNPFGFRKICREAEILIIGGGWEVPVHAFSMAYARMQRMEVYIISESVLESHRFKGRTVRLIRFLVFSLATKIISVGPRSTLAILETGIKRKKILELFNPVNVEFFNSISKSTKRAKFIGHRFIAVGRLIELKNFESIVRSFNLMSESTDTLTIAGEGPLRSSLERCVADLNLQDQVFFTGQLSQIELAKLYADSCTLILASTNEVWGMVATEALSAGCHVVVSDNCGVSTFVKGMRGTYICNTSIDSIATCMQESKSRYSGQIMNPEILNFTPERFARELSSAIF